MLTASDFYFRVFFGVFVEANINLTETLAHALAKGPIGDRIDWTPWHALRVGWSFEDGFIVVFLDMGGGDIVGARRTRFKTIKWMGKKPTRDVQMKLALLLPEKYNPS